MIVKIVMECDVCGKGMDASKALNITTSDSRGRIFYSIDVCTDCKRVFDGLVKETIEKAS